MRFVISMIWKEDILSNDNRSTPSISNQVLTILLLYEEWKILVPPLEEMIEQAGRKDARHRDKTLICTFFENATVNVTKNLCRSCLLRISPAEQMRAMSADWRVCSVVVLRSWLANPSFIPSRGWNMFHKSIYSGAAGYRRQFLVWAFCHHQSLMMMRGRCLPWLACSYFLSSTP